MKKMSYLKSGFPPNHPTAEAKTNIRFKIPVLPQAEWERLDSEISDRLYHWHLGLASADRTNISDINDFITFTIRHFLIKHEDLFLEPKNQTSSKGYISRGSQTLSLVRQEKQRLQKEALKPGATSKAKALWRMAVKAIQHLLRRDKDRILHKTVQFQEGRFRKDFYWFAKQASMGTLGKTPGMAKFTKEEADVHYWSQYSTAATINIKDLEWFSAIDTSSFTTPFDQSPITPGLVKATLHKCNLKSSPGPDGIRYGILYHLPSVHHILASLYTTILKIGKPPLAWGESTITLIHKKGPEDDPSNFRMIALSSCIGKLFHLILSRRLTTFLLENKIIDNAVQKAFLPGISGCFEHNTIMQEAIRHARTKKKTLHVTFFDLADAFGSVPHQLINFTLERHNLPNNIKEYVAKYLQNGWATVRTKSWSSERFKFAKGVFQGDPLSPILFIWIFNPIINSIQEDPKLGITIKGHTIATLPFADDFCLITTNKRTHQKAIDTISNRITSMGLKLKPSKCRSFSLSSGKPSIIHFTIKNSLVPSIAEEDQHYLGAKVFFLGKESEVVKELSTRTKSTLDNMDKTAVRSEYKLAVYSRYLLPSMRFLLTVHDLNLTSRRSLDSLCDKYLKKWTGLPKSGTNIILHSKTTLDIPTIQDLYRECHATTHSSTRLQGDTTVNTMLDHKLAREREWTKKTSTVCDSEALFLKARSTTLGLGSPNPLQSIKSNIKQCVKEDSERDRAEHARKLISQGHLIRLLQEMNIDATWQSYIHALPKGTMKFILNSAINTLPTKANLKLWGKSKSDKCVLCGRIQTLNHVLSSCPKALEEGCYTYRHNEGSSRRFSTTLTRTH